MSQRIAILFEYGTLNGGERSILAVIDRLREPSFDFCAIAPDRGRLADELRQRAIQIFPFSLFDASDVRQSREQTSNALRRTIDTISPDLVHANSLSMGRLTGAIAPQLQLPTVAHLRDILRLSRAAIADLNANRALVAVSEATRDFHVSQGLNSDTLRVLHNGVDCRQFSPRPRAGALRRALGVPDDAILLATIGQVGLRKGQDVLAQAAPLIQLQVPRSHYLLIGERNSSKDESRQFENAVIQQFADAGLAGRLHLLGYRDDVSDLLNEVDVLIHPAHQEPLGRVLLEAAASGLPVVATDVGGTREIFRDGESALLVPPNDPGELAAAVVRLCNDQALREKLAKAARQSAVKAFDIDRKALDQAALWINLVRAAP